MRSSLSTAAVLIGLLTSSGSMGAPASASPNAATLAVQPARISDLMPSATVGPCTINTSNPVFQHDAGGNYYVHANGGITCPSGAFVTSGYTYLNTDDLLAGIHNITLQGSGSTTVTNILLNSYCKSTSSSHQWQAVSEVMLTYNGTNYQQLVESSSVNIDCS